MTTTPPPVAPIDHWVLYQVFSWGLFPVLGGDFPTQAEALSRVAECSGRFILAHDGQPHTAIDCTAHTPITKRITP